MSQTKPTRPTATLTNVMRRRTAGLTSRIGRVLWAWGVHPDLITFVGLVIVAAAAYVAAHGAFFWAGVIIIAGSPLDAIDGAVARAMQREGKFGALWDSTLDRYADGFIFMGMAVYFSREGDEVGMVVSMLALLGSLLVSYVRARAGGLRVDCEVGVFTRMERTLVILAMLFTGWVKLGVWVLAIGTHFTAGQRVWHVYRELSRRSNSTS